MSQLSLDFTGKVALITGGGSGIGRGFALQLARCGATVAVTDLDGAAAEAVAGEVEALGGRSLRAAVDVADAAAVQAAVDRTIERFGHLDFVFANAGVLGPAEYLDITPADWDLVLDVNIKGVVHTCRAAVPHLIERQQGRILITASYNGVRAGAHVIPYRVSKAAVLMYTRCLALVLAPHNVTVNAICPGVTLTPMQLAYAEKTAEERGITTEEYLADRAAKIPMQHFTGIEDLTGLAQFLLSDSARLITGQAIAPDGGVTISS
ncbi:SDR family oxidoreductase [Caldilinea sp.]|uniref:SDR family NAD(P)-dependent oxidoreductase n=1 Tax=Caldilinea sp. TaxID=2293560 RepID=UPI002BE95846|nr:SDR family oxidoreductase [Caldilinea sp.]